MILTHPVVPPLPEIRCEPRAMPAYIPSSAETREMHTLWMQARELHRALLSRAMSHGDEPMREQARQVNALADALAIRWMRLHDADKTLAMAEHFGGVS